MIPTKVNCKDVFIKSLRDVYQFIYITNDIDL